MNMMHDWMQPRMDECTIGLMGHSVCVGPIWTHGLCAMRQNDVRLFRSKYPTIDVLRP